MNISSRIEACQAYFAAIKVYVTDYTFCVERVKEILKKFWEIRSTENTN